MLTYLDILSSRLRPYCVFVRRVDSGFTTGYGAMAGVQIRRCARSPATGVPSPTRGDAGFLRSEDRCACGTARVEGGYAS